MKKSNKRTRKSRKWSGAKWIRPEKRLAIYDRDGWCCLYCGWASDQNDNAVMLNNVCISFGFAEELGFGLAGAAVDAYLNHLTLDHVKPVAAGGTNGAWNLVTACHWCNSRRQSHTTRQWFALLRRNNIDVRKVQRRIKRQARELTREERARGLELLALRVEARARV